MEGVLGHRHPLAISEQGATAEAKLPDTPGRWLRSVIHVDNIGNIRTTNHLGTDVEDYPDDDFYSDVDDHAGAPHHRWRPVAAIGAGVLVLAVIATALIVNGGDSGTTTATVVGPPPTRTVIATPGPTLPTAAPSTSLPRETVTTVTPPPTTPPTTATSSS
ncbi:MAG: hypothetical protein JO106_04385, partial [Mycobacterium sp.]|nr:hypothetical protein [Mycobacterium sp.]